MATTAKGRERLEAEIAARLTEDQRRTSRRVLWIDRLTSLWTPVTIFAGALVLYMILVELDTPAYHWAQPVLKVFGLLMLASMVGLLIVRNVFWSFSKMRRLRHNARELLSELEDLLARRGDKIDPKVREKLVEQAAGVDAARLGRDPEKLEAELGRLSDQIEKQLGAYRKNSTLDFVVGFAKAFAVAMLIRAIIIEPFKIPSGSMIPTLEIGDQIFVNKFIYGVRIPYMNIVPFKIVREPERGDVIVFNNPVNEDLDFIKRVIGIPGDRIKIVNEVLYINGQPQPRQLLQPNYTFWGQGPGGHWDGETAQLYEENLSGHAHTLLQLPWTCQEPDNPKCTYQRGEEFVVPPKSVFVMGDNRDNSADGRFGLGIEAKGLQFVPWGNIKGKAMVIWLSLSHDGFLSGLFGGTGLRTDRLFRPVR